MARHRVGDSYLSDSEYNLHISENWGSCLFLIASILSGFLMHHYILKHLHITNHNLRFAVIVLSALTVGCVVYRLRDLIRAVICFCAGILFIGFILEIIYKAV